MGELEPRRRDRVTEAVSYAEVALGLVFVIAAVALLSTGLSSGVFFFGLPLLLPAAWLLGRAPGRRGARPGAVVWQGAGTAVRHPG